MKRRRFVGSAAVLGASLLLAACHRLPHDDARCEVVRAAVDIGSGTTKMVVARVDRCGGRVVRVLAPEPGMKLERKVDFAGSIVAGPDGRRVFEPETIAAGLAALLDLKQVALGHGAAEFSAVATSAFRKVDESHALEVLEGYERATGIRCRVITQEEEARTGYFAAVAKLGLSRTSPVVVWDAGGGSMQISAWDSGAGSLVGYRGRLGSEAMLRFIREELQRRGHASGLLSDADDTDRTAVLDLAMLESETAVGSEQPSALVATLRDPGVTVIGIGGVHYYSNCELMRRAAADGCTFTRAELLDQVRRHAHLTYQELFDRGFVAEPEFAPYRVPNALLTLGAMRALGIESVRAIKTDMADGILLDASAWGSGPSLDREATAGSELRRRTTGVR